MLTYGSAHVSVTFRLLCGSAPSSIDRNKEDSKRCRVPVKTLQAAGQVSTSVRQRSRIRCWKHDLCNNNFISNAILGCKGNQVRTRKRSKQRIMSASNQTFSQIAPRRLATLVSRTSSHVRLLILHACCHRMRSSIFFFFSSTATSCFARIFHTCLFLFIDGIYPSCCQAVGIVGS